MNKQSCHCFSLSVFVVLVLCVQSGFRLSCTNKVMGTPPQAMTSSSQILCETVHSQAAFEYESAVTRRKTPGTKGSPDPSHPFSPLNFLKHGVLPDEDSLLFFPAERL